MIFRFLFLLIVGILSTYVLLKNNSKLLLFFLITAPFSYFGVNIGVVLSPAKLIAIITFIFWVFTNRGILVRSSLLDKLYTYYLYLILSTLFLSAFWPEYNTFNQGILYSTSFRGVVQVFLLSIQVIMISVFVKFSIRTDIHAVLVKYSWILLLIIIYGIYTYFAQINDYPFTGINRQGLGESGTAISFGFADTRIFRAYSLTGEPKQLAVDAIIGLVLWYKFYFRLHDRRSLFFQGLVYSAFLSALFLTYSTAGFIIAIIVIGCLLFLTQVNINKLFRQFFAAISVLAIIVLLKMQIFSSIVGLFEYRVNDRLEEESIAGYAEEAALNVISKNPLVMIAGVGLGGSSFYVRAENSEQYAGYTAAPRGIVGLILDQGLIGITLLGRVIFSAYMKLKNIKNRTLSIFKWKDLLRSLLVLQTILLCTISQWYLFIGLFGLVFVGIDRLSRENI